MPDTSATPDPAAASSAASSAPQRSCGNCGYLVHPEAGFICPECGSDLRQVGIVKAPPADTRRRRITFIVVALAWSVICFVLSSIFYDLVRQNYWPLSLHSTRHYLWTPEGGQYQSVTLEEHIGGTVYGSRNLDRSFPEISDKLKYELVGTINGPNGPTILEVDLLKGTSWQLSHSGGGPQNSGLKLDKAAMLGWFKAAGTDPFSTDSSGKLRQQEADEILGIITRLAAFVPSIDSFNDLAHGVGQSANFGRPSARSITVFPGGYSNGAVTADSHQLPVWTALSVTIYLLGLWLCYRRLWRTAGIPAGGGAAVRQTLPASAPAEPARSPEVTHRLLSILFSDIKDYTAQSAVQSRAGVLDIVRQHRERVLPVVKRHGGRVVKQMGDGILATFDSATEAVLAAIEIQRPPPGSSPAASQGAPPPDGAALELRIGISTGEVTVESDDVFGPAVNLASRVLQLAAAGQVLFTETTYSMLNGREISARELGTFELKGVPAPVKVYEA
jgi:class 3 adenylate cyclase